MPPILLDVPNRLLGEEEEDEDPRDKEEQFDGFEGYQLSLGSGIGFGERHFKQIL